MRRHRQSRWSNKVLSIGMAVICGGAAMVLSVALLSALSFYIIGSIQFIGFFAMLSIAVGGFVAGYIYGKFRRRQGLIGGVICGAVLFVAIIIAGIFIFGSPGDIRKLLLLSIAGIAGGVTGVNSKRPKGLTD